MNLQWSRLLGLMLRDGVLIALTFLLWDWTLSLGRPQGLGPVAVHIGTALMTVLCGYLIHEWGHLTGALLARGSVVLPRMFESPFLFRFDLHRNTRRQFTWMASGGFVASILLVILLVARLPACPPACWRRRSRWPWSHSACSPPSSSRCRSSGAW